ncbi:MAG: sigma-70 family RNA polymerase sigma factor [Planctomycetes bacterium]|nr:sigma-70 family RNA polymerase sigma factor [Planctomycetota bacterium]
MSSGPTASDSPEAPFPAALAAARAREPAALEALFARFYPRVERQVHVALTTDLRRSRPWLATRFSTGDIVQEVFRSVLVDLGGFAGTTEEEFAGYLASVVRNRLLDALRFHEAERRDGRRTIADPDPRQLSPQCGPATDAIAADDRRLYDEVLRTFPERERQLLRGRLEQEREFKDLCRELGYSSLSATRRAFYAAEAQLVIRIRQRSSQQTP